MEWIYNGKDKPFTCPHCGSGCLLNYESDYSPSVYCPHCGQKLDPPRESWTSNKSDYEPPIGFTRGWSCR